MMIWRWKKRNTRTSGNAARIAGAMFCDALRRLMSLYCAIEISTMIAKNR